MASPVGKAARIVLVPIGYALWVSTMVLTPLFGFWLASSLAAYHNASPWLALLVGFLLFPILPVCWELFFIWRHNRKKTPAPTILTPLDRLVLRTLIINAVFLGGMMWQARDAAFRALTVRGDWMLDGYDGPMASTIRGWMLALADRLDRPSLPENHYGESDEPPDDIKPPDQPLPTPVVDVMLPDSAPPVEPARDPNAWPMPRGLHPLVVSMPESEQTSVEAVGQYFAGRISDKRELTKALHDYVIHRLHYEDETAKAIDAEDWDNVPSQQANDVFARRAGVCSGYSRLLTALGKAAGLEIAYVTGYARDLQRRFAVAEDPPDMTAEEVLEGSGHAWNAVKLDDEWHLVDATWDDPKDGEPKTTYLLVPPQLMVYDHYPEDPKWQLLASPLSLGDFIRQPMLDPLMAELGVTLVSPNRSQVTVEDEVTIVLDNPYGAEMTAVAVIDGSRRDAEGTRCRDGISGRRTTIICELGEGEYEVKMFATPKAKATGQGYRLDYVGSILVNSR